MNFIKYRVIELIDKHKKITAVADELGLKQPTISFHMKNMENELGIKLFDSWSGKVVLTEAGQALLHYAVKINSLSQEATRMVKEFDALGRGSLLIGASFVPGTYILPRILSKMTDLYPQITISLTLKPMPVIKEMLLNHQIDIGIVSTDPAQLSMLKSEKLCEDELVVVFSPLHPLAGFSQLEPWQLSGQRFIMHGQDSNTRRMTVSWAESNSIRLNGQVEIDSPEAMKKMIMQGGWIGFISRLAIKEEVERGELEYRSIPHNMLKRCVYYAYNPDRRQTALLNQLIVQLTAL